METYKKDASYTQKTTTYSGKVASNSLKTSIDSKAISESFFLIAYGPAFAPGSFIAILPNKSQRFTNHHLSVLGSTFERKCIEKNPFANTNNPSSHVFIYLFCFPWQVQIKGVAIYTTIKTR